MAEERRRAPRVTVTVRESAFDKLLEALPVLMMLRALGTPTVRLIVEGGAKVSVEREKIIVKGGAVTGAAEVAARAASAGFAEFAVSGTAEKAYDTKTGGIESFSIPAYVTVQSGG